MVKCQGLEAGEPYFATVRQISCVSPNGQADGMIAPQFSPGAAIRYGWESFKSRPWFFVAATFVIAVLYALAGSIRFGIDSMLGGSTEEPTIAGSIVNYALGTLISMGVTAFYLAAHDNAEAAEAARAIHPQVAIPMHRWKTNPSEFRRKVEADSDIKAVLLGEGEEYKVV